TAKRLLSDQTFREIYRTDVLGIDQRFKITSMTFLFTDLKGSTELYERVGDLAAFDLVRAHFQALTKIVAQEGGAIVKTIGDAVMATFVNPRQGFNAALRMLDAIDELNDKVGRTDLRLKIGLHQGSCLAVTLNERQDYFGQAVNIASRLQSLAESHSILTTDAVVNDIDVKSIIAQNSLGISRREELLRGLKAEIIVHRIG
ncbi:MAG: adenylate/guanylate cyclase domain-containing protein, partial [Dongiaceae bacterium]